MNIARKCVVFFMTWILFSSSVHAGGNTLIEQCRAAVRIMETREMTNEFDAGMCLGVVKAVRDTMEIMAKNGLIDVCFPRTGLTNGQAARIVLSYLDRNPARLHYNEVSSVMVAYFEAYGCE